MSKKTEVAKQFSFIVSTQDIKVRDALYGHVIDMRSMLYPEEEIIVDVFEGNTQIIGPDDQPQTGEPVCTSTN